MIDIDIKGKTYKQITKLDLSRKSLTTFPREVLQCTNLRKLILSNNQISKIPKDILVLKKLKVLDVSHNCLTQLHASIFQLSKLEIINASFNAIKSIPKQIESSGIKTLLLQHNHISTLSAEMIYHLEKLNISNNQIKQLDLSDRMFYLNLIWISGNPIQRLNINLSKLTRLKAIYAYTADNNCYRIKDSIYKKMCEVKGNSLEQLKLNMPRDEETEIEYKKSEHEVTIFISYAHNDEKWLSLLKKHLKVLQREFSFKYWDDNRIRTGNSWREEIEYALNVARAAILLVSTDFLASDFIRDVELSTLLKKAEKNGTKIFPVIVSPCRFKETKALEGIEAVNNPEKTLNECTEPERERIMLKLMDDLENWLKK
jgi:hypothetical protein